jgi:nucleotide-binding universal stress UspA family protein
MKLLLAVDSSEASERAVRKVASRPWPHGTQVRLLTVVEKNAPPAALLWYDAGGDPDAAERELLWRAEGQLRQFVEELKTAGLSVECLIREGEPKTTILKECKQWQADLLILGAHEHRWLKRLFLGSVSQWMTKHACCSMEVIH